ncbi:methyltransferase domain-containing protein [Cohnella sp. CFH 77786]|uniref:methyltransferase domain-containing protein n=1 Tax=Cohnella sp. CFH 77786 TaxID=2662265 RepID=UPI001C60B318|nr:class I SAM-dependent methyltransferase [Cohnella sp. CFH 77786]MBW5449354.1 methyltransferase domain-containing protein [Cohnella sp. CFH 77786]
MDLRVAPAKLDRIISPYLLFFLKRYAASLSLENRVLDLGSGKWRHSNFMYRIGFKNVSCIDRYSFPKMPDYITFIEHNLENKIEFLEQKFDIIIATFLFMFIENKRLLVNEITRLSAPNAYFICTLNQKKTSAFRPALSFGKATTPDEIITLLDPALWEIMHRNKDSFIAKRREGMAYGEGQTREKE